MKYAFIASYESHFSAKRMCQVLKVTRSGYYAWRNRPMSKREQSNQVLLESIKKVFQASRKTYGSPRI
jgi:putative transposase